MARLEIHKFGGTSVGSAERFLSVADLVERASAEAHVVVVVSAMAGVTDQLVALAEAGAGHRRDEGERVLAELLEKHLETVEALGSAVLHRVPDRAKALAADIERIWAGLRDRFRAVVALEELSPRARDAILATGEKLSARILATVLEARGRTAKALDADTFLETDGCHGEATPVAGVVDRTIAATLEPLLAHGVVPVVTGYCGRAPDGATTTLGRGGSDLSATLIAAALGADSVTIWTDVDGAYSADPRVVPEARLIRQLNYQEAAEMSYYGAKVLHQRTIIPVARPGIPVLVRNSLRPGAEGTVVDRRFTPGSHPVKAISAIHGQALVSVEGKGMAGVPGVAARLFQTLADRGISVTMISQSSSESSICLAVPEEAALAAEMALKQQFRLDISYGNIEEVVVRQRVGLVAAVGLGMAQTPGVAARVFACLGARGINVMAIAQGSSELSISVAVDESHVPEAIQAIHAEFGLHRTDTGVDSPAGFDLLLLGCGQIGRRLIQLLRDRREHIRQRFGLEVRVVGVSDRSGFLLDPTGLSDARLEEILQTKTDGGSLAQLQGGVSALDPAALLRKAVTYRLVRPVLVDVSDCATSAALFKEAFRNDCDVVTANKKPLTGPYHEFQDLMREAAAAGRLLRAEATVGAGLPVVDTLEMLIATGDRLTGAQGCLSGTLGFIMGRLEDGIPFSRAVAEAVEAGFTEPDPVADLSGADVARKAMILGRLSGLIQDDTPVALEGLVDPKLAGMTQDALLQRLKEYDEPFAQRVQKAQVQGQVLRYVARVARDTMEVGVQAVPAGSSIGSLKGADNLIVFESDRYRPRPLVVIGPGAGIDVTAMGVLGDILRIAAERKLT